MSNRKFSVPNNEQVDKIRKLRAAIIAGEDSGPATPFNIDDFLGQMRDDPFATFTEWSGNAGEKAFRKLK